MNPLVHKQHHTPSLKMSTSPLNPARGLLSLHSLNLQHAIHHSSSKYRYANMLRRPVNPSLERFLPPCAPPQAGLGEYRQGLMRDVSVLSIHRGVVSTQGHLNTPRQAQRTGKFWVVPPVPVPDVKPMLTVGRYCRGSALVRDVDGAPSDNGIHRCPDFK